jgi:hypothetical protein
MRKFLALGLVALSLACSSSGAKKTSPSGGRNLLTAGEITERGGDVSNALEALERLRPDFLRMSRGPTTLGDDASGTSFYINNERQPNSESLRNVPVREIREIRRLSASEAQMKFGLNNMHGAIQVITVRQ